MSIFDHVSLKTTRLADMQRFYETVLATAHLVTNRVAISAIRTVRCA